MYPATQYQCQCVGLPADFDLDAAWIVGGGFISKQSQKIDMCIQNGGWLEK